MFDDREQAGKFLADVIKDHPEFLENSVLYAIPRGGVPIAYSIASVLKIPIPLIITKKLASPMNPEFGFGAIAPDGTYLLNKRALSYLNLSKDQFDKIKAKVLRDVKGRFKDYNHDFFLDASRKTAIVVDDGIATGYTAMVAGKYLKKNGATKTILAVPIGPISSIEKAKKYFDNVICIKTDNSGHFAVGSFYKDFHQISDDEMLSYLDKAKKIDLINKNYKNYGVS